MDERVEAMITRRTEYIGASNSPRRITAVGDLTFPTPQRNKKMPNGRK